MCAWDALAFVRQRVHVCTCASVHVDWFASVRAYRHAYVRKTRICSWHSYGTCCSVDLRFRGDVNSWPHFQVMKSVEMCQLFGRCQFMATPSRHDVSGDVSALCFRDVHSWRCINSWLSRKYFAEDVSPPCYRDVHLWIFISSLRSRMLH